MRLDRDFCLYCLVGLLLFGTGILISSSQRSWMADESGYLGAGAAWRMPLPPLIFNSLEFLGDFRLLLISAVLLFVTFLLVGEVFGREAGLISMVLLPAHSIVFYYSNRFLAESLTLVFAGLAAYYLIRIIKEGSNWNWAGFFLSSI